MRRRAKRPRILHLLDTPGPGGAETVFMDLATRMSSACWESMVSIPRPDGWAYDMLVASGVRPMFVPTRGTFDVRYLTKLIWIIMKHGVDLLHAHMFTASVYGTAACFATGIPAIRTMHGEWDLPRDGRLIGLKRWSLQLGTGCTVFVSESVRRAFIRRAGLSATNTTVIPNGIDTERFAPRRNSSLRHELGLAPDAVIVGAVGNIRPAKDYETLVRAAAILAARSERYHVVVAGDGAGALMDRLLTLRRELGLENRLSFLGFRARVERIINGFDLFVLSSSSEGFSLATVEAMACGVPVVATKSGGPEEILREGVDGILVSRGSPQALAAGIEALWADPAKAKRMARAARARVETKYSLPTMLRRYEELYDRYLAR